MAHLGLPVPPGFTITTEVCTYFSENGKTYPKDLRLQVETALAEVGRITGKKIRRWRESAARLGALGRARVDAGHDGYRARWARGIEGRLSAAAMVIVPFGCVLPEKI
jgi:phosphoenolpyruvate synthase/pyruvate phosphate dikinase